MKKIPTFNSRSEAIAFLSNEVVSQQYGAWQDFSRTFTATRNSADTVLLDLAASHTMITEYNIQYGLQASGIESLYIRFTERDTNRQWQNELVPIRLISTPGAVIVGQPGVRYGAREWWRTAQPNEKLAIEWKNTSTTDDLEISVLFKAWVWKVGLA